MSDVTRLIRTTRWAQIATLIMIGLIIFDVTEIVFLDWQLIPTSGVFQQSLIDVMTVSDFVVMALLIVNLRWIYVAATYYQNRAPEGHIRPHWAAWSNFIPFINLWAPYVQIRRIWQVSAGLHMGFPARLRVWWGAWVFQYLAVGVFLVLTMNAASLVFIEDNSAYFFPVLSVVDFITTILFYWIITQIGGAYGTDADVFR